MLPAVHAARPSALRPPPVEGRSYRIQQGDTLSRIAAAHGTTVDALMRANPDIAHPDRIYAGDVLRIPVDAQPPSRPRTHVVRAGDTLWALARRYDTDVATLARLNGIPDPNLIHVGDRLSLPGGGGGGRTRPTDGAPPASTPSTGRGGGDWMRIARGEQGQSEIRGSADNARIVQYHQTTTLRATDDETPWCSSFVNWTMERAGYRGTDSAAAVSWRNWGDGVAGGLANAREGDIVVIQRKGAGSGGHHVGFFSRSAPGGFVLLGGNQSDTVKESTFSLSSYNVLAVRRPPGGGTAAAPAPVQPGGGGRTGLREADFARVAQRLGVDVAAIKAVAEVEASGDGFLPSGKPKILFEAHVFARETGGRYNRSHPNLSSPHWNRSLYGAGGEHQWDRFEQAYRLNPEAAIKATSWGRFQIMGFNHRAAGHADVQAFVAAMRRSEGEHLDAFARFIESNPSMHRALRQHDWAAFARAYNGPGYAENQYDTKIAQAWRRHSQ